MLTKTMYIFIVTFFAISSVTACSKRESKKVGQVQQQEMITTVLTGSTDTPDPVLIRVQLLEQQGVLSDVVIMESYPVQIKITGPKEVVNDLISFSKKE